MTHPQFGKFEPGSIWQKGERLYIIRDDGRVLAYPSMHLLPIAPDLSNAQRCGIYWDGSEAFTDDE